MPNALPLSPLGVTEVDQSRNCDARKGKGGGEPGEPGENPEPEGDAAAQRSDLGHASHGARDG